MKKNSASVSFEPKAKRSPVLDSFRRQDHPTFSLQPLSGVVYNQNCSGRFDAAQPGPMGLSSFRTICVTVCRTHLTKEWSLVCERHPSQSCSELISLPAFSAAACSERPSGSETHLVISGSPYPGTVMETHADFFTDYRGFVDD